ncbi:Cytokinin dehydrogenase 3 [Camellia lanceoleosa]|uniref:Cytokinin dehydrogenase 3 n=1 Tax=Camellia lanceoleosa TaxID=1840588 RepID=A0ACC0FHZ9_9ERIC|nr:Cytokinin dehydrogenase 3 [Camellia lanceoleosa]
MADIVFLIVSCLTFIIGKLSPSTSISLPRELLTLYICNKLRLDNNAIELAPRDYGKLVQETPLGVLYPSLVDDIATQLKFSYDSPNPFSIAARGRSHSIRGQAMAHNGVVVQMTSLKHCSYDSGIRVFRYPSSLLGFYADVGGGELWIDVLLATLEHGRAPVSWTDYLHLTVGGTLSNAGISGQAFVYGPQIRKGELFTCSKHINLESFYAVLGGRGQFGIITRARVALGKAPNRVKWVKMLYHDFSSFTRDQEHLISINGGLDYLEGFVVANQNPPNNLRLSFFSPSDQLKINSLVDKHGVIYCLEVITYYDDLTIDAVEKVHHFFLVLL